MLNGNEGRIWLRDLRRDPRVTVADRNNPYVWVEVKGRVIEDTHEGALEHIHKLAMKYMGERRSTPSWNPGAARAREGRGGEDLKLDPCPSGSPGTSLPWHRIPLTHARKCQQA